MKIAGHFARSHVGVAMLSSSWRGCAAPILLLAMALPACGGDTGHGPIFISDAARDNGSGNGDEDKDGSFNGADAGTNPRNDSGTSDTRNDGSTNSDASQDLAATDGKNDASLSDAPNATDTATERTDTAGGNADTSITDTRSDIALDISIDGTASDAHLADTIDVGNQDVSVDTSPPTDSGGDDAAADSGKPPWATCDPFVASAACASCENDNCPRDPAGCSAGACTVQPWCDDYASPADQALCKAVVSCMRLSNCIALGTVNCFCGQGVDIASCTSSLSQAQGLCKDQIVAGFAPLATSKEIVNAMGDVKYPAGGALALGNCDYVACGSPNQNPGATNECIPFCKETADGGTDAGLDANGDTHD